jgi:hypothetical protein
MTMRSRPDSYRYPLSEHPSSTMGTRKSSRAADTQQCREYMICPLPRANDLTAPNWLPGCHPHLLGGHGLYPGGSGASREGARGPHAGAQWTTAVDSRGRGVGRERPHRAAPAPPQVTVSYSFVKKALQASGLVTSTVRGARIAAAASRAPASASCCTSWRRARGRARPRS